ncbi:MAG TPA: hypothetical protein VKX25_02140 [Bryobacteraceae bacterium]|nr:hypothetical protein [Bryobacteraceae bacterium]
MEAAFGGGEGTLDDSHQFEIVAAFAVWGIERTDLETPVAANPPGVVDEFVDQDIFGSGGWIVLGEERLAEFFEFLRILGGEDQGPGVNAVFERILGGTLLPLVGFWAG